MIDISALYNVRTHRYKGVYQGPGRDQWDAIVQTIEGKLQRKGRFTNPEEAARAVATYYLDVYGEGWAEVIKHRMERDWRIRRNVRFPYMAALHKGPKVVCYTAMVRLVDKQWRHIRPIDIIHSDTLTMWDKDGDGWVSTTAALVAIRMFRATAASSPPIVPPES